MTKRAKLLSFFGLLALASLALGYFAVNWAMRQPCSPPDRPRIVPSIAAWAGGCDGGSWVQVLSSRKGSFHLRIYDHPGGNLAVEGWFRPVAGCASPPTSSKDVMDHLSAYDGQRLLLDAGSACSLARERKDSP